MNTNFSGYVNEYLDGVRLTDAQIISQTITPNTRLNSVSLTDVKLSVSIKCIIDGYCGPITKIYNVSMGLPVSDTIIDCMESEEELHKLIKYISAKEDDFKLVLKNKVNEGIEPSRSRLKSLHKVNHVFNKSNNPINKEKTKHDFILIGFKEAIVAIIADYYKSIIKDYLVRTYPELYI